MRKCTDNRIGEWIGLYEFGGLDGPELEAFLDHLIQCEYCYDQVYSMAPVSTAFQRRRTAAQAAGLDQALANGADVGRGPAPSWFAAFWVNRLALAGASMFLMVCALLVGLYLTVGPSEREDRGGSTPQEIAAGDKTYPWKDLDIPKAAYFPQDQGVVLRKPGRPFVLAMAAYQENRFGEAIEQLETLTEIEPTNADVKFYLGVSRLLIGRYQEAKAPLKEAAPLGTGVEREKCHYYLALAYLKTNQPRLAVPELEAVIQMNGDYRMPAEELKEQALVVDR
jgi:tetratricopeptide (TPR) repeat protein